MFLGAPISVDDRCSYDDPVVLVTVNWVMFTFEPATTRLLVNAWTS